MSAGPVAAGGARLLTSRFARTLAPPNFTLAVRKHLRLIPLCGTQPRSNRNAVAAFSPALAAEVVAVCKHLRWVTKENENNSDMSGLGNRERNLAKPKACSAERAGTGESIPLGFAG